MVKAIVLYEDEPDAERYAQHVDEFGDAVPGATFRHGRVFGSPIGDGRYKHYAEFEWPDMESFKAGAASKEFAASGQDAMSIGIPFHVYFVETG